MNKQEEQGLLLKIVKTWSINRDPEYRGFRCANCQQYQNKMWHHYLNSENFILPVHLCEKCEQDFQSGNILINSSNKPLIDVTNFLEGYQLDENTRQEFRGIVEGWSLNSAPELKEFTCDKCKEKLEVDLIDGQRKGYHVWFRLNNETLAELHFHKECFQSFGNLQ
jgi:hypothetical protein